MANKLFGRRRRPYFKYGESLTFISPLVSLHIESILKVDLYTYSHLQPPYCFSGLEAGPVIQDFLVRKSGSLAAIISQPKQMNN